MGLSGGLADSQRLTIADTPLLGRGCGKLPGIPFNSILTNASLTKSYKLNNKMFTADLPRSSVPSWTGTTAWMVDDLPQNGLHFREYHNHPGQTAPRSKRPRIPASHLDSVMLVSICSIRPFAGVAHSLNEHIHFDDLCLRNGIVLDQRAQTIVYRIASAYLFVYSENDHNQTFVLNWLVGAI